MATGDGFSDSKPWETRGDGFQQDMEEAVGGRKNGTNWNFLTWGELEKDPKPIEWVVEDVLERGNFGVFYGPPGSAKSFVAIDLAACIATGNPFHGNDTSKGLVLYCGGEGPQAFSRRLRAWRLGNNIDGRGSPFVYLANRVGFFDPNMALSLADATDKLQEEHGVELRAVIVDTWQRHLGADENSTAEVSVACEHLMAQFRDRFGATIAVLHHTGWGENARLRGSRVLQAECDSLFQVQLDQENDRTTMVCERMRDGNKPPDMVFKGESINVAPNGGREETSWYLRLIEGMRVNKTEHALGEKEKAVLAIVRRLHRDEQQRMVRNNHDAELAEVTPVIIKAAVHRAGLYPDDDKGMRAAGNVVRRLLGKRLLVKIGRNFKPTTQM